MKFKFVATPEFGAKPNINLKLDFVVKPNFLSLCCLALIFTFAAPGFGQSIIDQDSTTSQKEVHKKKKNKKHKGSGKEIGQGGKDIGKGAAKGAVDLGEGAAGTAGNLATGNVIGAGISAGTGVVGAGAHVGVSAAKGTYKIGKGTGGLIRKLARRSRKKDENGD